MYDTVLTAALQALACIPSPSLYQASAWAWARPELALGPLLGPGSSLSQAQAISSQAQAWAFELSQALHITIYSEDFVSIDLTSDVSLDKYDSFYVNQYADHNVFEII